MTTPPSWTVAWAQAETQVTVAGTAATITIAPDGALAATITVTATGEAASILQPPDTEVIYPAPAAALQPAD